MYEQFQTQTPAAAPYWSGMRIIALVTALVLLVTGVVGTAFQVSAVERFPVQTADPANSGRPDSPEADSPDPSGEAEDPAAKTAEAMQAYLALLTENREGLEGYYWQKGYYNYSQPTEETTPKPVAILDCWGDEVPELIYVSVDPTEEYQFMSYLHILSWDGALRTLYEGSWDVMAGGGYYYCLYQLQDSKELFAWTSYGDESWTVRHIRFAEEGRSLVPVTVLLKENKFVYQDGEYEYDNRFLVGEEDVDEETYGAALSALEQRMRSVVMSSREIGEPASLLLAEQGEAAMSVSDALFRLTEQTLPKRGAAELEPEAMPKDMLQFLTQFVGWYADGNGGHEFRAGRNDLALLNSMINNGSCVLYRLYPGEGQVDYWGETDPRGWAGEAGGYGSYASYDAESVEWIAVNIFHLSPAELPSLVSEAESARLFYRQKADNGKSYYYRSIGGVGDPFLKLVPRTVSWENGKYTLVYDVCFDTDWSSRYPSNDGEYLYTACAVLGREEIDGSSYWTLYSNSLELPEAPAEVPDPELFARMPAYYSFTSGMGAWGTSLILEEDGSFRGRFQDDNMGESGEDYDGTRYYADFTGRFANPRRIDRYTWAFDLAELNNLGAVGEETIADLGYGRTRTICAEPYGLAGGTTFYYYEQGAPRYRLPESFLQWLYAYSGYNDPTLRRAGLYNEAQELGFAAVGGTQRYESWSEAYRDFLCNNEFYHDGDLELGYGSLYAETDPPAAALHDTDGDGVPELLLFNGQELPERQAIYVFCFRGGRVHYVESAAPDAFDDLIGAVPVMPVAELIQDGWDEFLAAYYGGEGGAVRALQLPELTGERSLSWGWDLFREDPEAYSGELAQAGAFLCGSLETAAATDAGAYPGLVLSGGSPEQRLAALGFEQVTSAEAELPAGFGAVFGVRRLRWDGADRLIAAVVVTEPKTDSLSDYLALVQEIEPLSANAAQLLREALGDYLEGLEPYTEADGTTLWLSGFGLSGAVVGRLVPLARSVYAASDAIFAYSYDAPRYSDAAAQTERLDCLHNLLDSRDLITALPWGLGRLGKDLYLGNDAELTAAALAHSPAALPVLLDGGAPQQTEESSLERIVLERPGTLRVTDAAGRVAAELRDGELRLENDAPFLLLPEDEGYALYAPTGCELSLVMTGEENADSAVLRQRFTPASGELTELASCPGLRLRKGTAWCLPVRGELDPDRVLFELNDSGRVVCRISSDGGVHNAIFGNELLGWVFVGLTGLGLVTLLLSLLIRKRRR